MSFDKARVDIGKILQEVKDEGANMTAVEDSVKDSKQQINEPESDRAHNNDIWARKMDQATYAV